MTWLREEPSFEWNVCLNPVGLEAIVLLYQISANNVPTLTYALTWQSSKGKEVILKKKRQAHVNDPQNCTFWSTPELDNSILVVFDNKF